MAGARIMADKELHIDDAESEDEASVVDNGRALEDADVDDGGVDADLCDSRPVRLALDSSNRDNARVSAIGLEFELHGTGFPREAEYGIILRGEEEREYTVCELVGHE